MQIEVGKILRVLIRGALVVGAGICAYQVPSGSWAKLPFLASTALALLVLSSRLNLRRGHVIRDISWLGIALMFWALIAVALPVCFRMTEVSGNVSSLIGWTFGLGAMGGSALLLLKSWNEPLIGTLPTLFLQAIGRAVRLFPLLAGLIGLFFLLDGLIYHFVSNEWTFGPHFDIDDDFYVRGVSRLDETISGSIRYVCLGFICFVIMRKHQKPSPEGEVSISFSTWARNIGVASLWSLVVLATLMIMGHLAMAVKPISHGGALFAVITVSYVILGIFACVLVLRSTVLVPILFAERGNLRGAISRCFSVTKGQTLFLLCYWIFRWVWQYVALALMVAVCFLFGIEPEIYGSDSGFDSGTGPHTHLLLSALWRPEAWIPGLVYWLVHSLVDGAFLAGVYLELRKRAGEDPSQPVGVHSGGESPAL